MRLNRPCFECVVFNVYSQIITLQDKFVLQIGHQIKTILLLLQLQERNWNIIMLASIIYFYMWLVDSTIAQVTSSMCI